MQAMIQVESNVREFKKCIKDAAMLHQSNQSSLQRTHSGFGARSREFMQQMEYIEGVIFGGKAQELTKTEVEMLLLRWLGTKFTTQTLDYVMVSASSSHVSQIMQVDTQTGLDVPRCCSRDAYFAHSLQL